MNTCKLCYQNLVIELEDESEAIPDDLELSCGCHFHWQCLLDKSPSISMSLQCPSCNTSIVSQLAGPSATYTLPPGGRSQQPQLLVCYQNEGGIQNHLDILPLVTEEAYLDAHPAERPARAFMILCGEGDVAGIVELLGAIEEDRDEEDMSPSDLLRYQDPIYENKTGLHVAVEKRQQEVVWLLLWLASHLQTEVFPEEVIEAAQNLDASRKFAVGADIRGFRDDQHRNAEDIARNMPTVWGGLVGAGILKC
ncbi:hypothetical protein BGZ60DRAFT_104378 [Tricladium varicosporioides]|nr:hypothetical protein BGZ60DRAFT_104378 [Hymenoscyphus varicosporioides]